MKVFKKEIGFLARFPKVTNRVVWKPISKNYPDREMSK
jgi:hypothetical protein